MTRKLATALSFLSLTTITCPACDSDSPSDKNQDPAAASTVARSNLERVTAPQVSETDANALALDNASFAVDAYHKLVTEQQNFVFSPASVSIALAMAYAGAAGATATEMAQAMHYALPSDRLFAAFDQLDLALSSRGQGKLGSDGGPMQLNIVNAAWAERTYSFRPEYLDILAANFGAGINLLDFIHNWEPARIAINDWAAAKTANRITDLLPPGTTDTLTRLVLTNAVYLNAAWKEPFDAENTRDATFSTADGSSVTTKFMGTTLSGARAMQGTDFAAVSLPYDDDRLSMLVLVPNSGAFTAFESSLDGAKLGSIVAGLTVQSVALSMPRFRTETAQDFVSILQSLGMRAAFQYGMADFSGMDGSQSLFISNVLHKAFIDVGEKGTEAAAATAVVMKTRGAISTAALTLTVDRPFIYVLRDEPTGAILFIGRVLDPSKS